MSSWQIHRTGIEEREAGVQRPSEDDGNKGNKADSKFRARDIPISSASSL